MTENEIKEYVTEIRHKADIFRKSGFATAGFATHFDKSADIIEELLPYMAIGTIEEFKALKDIDEDLRFKYCYEDLSNAENRGYCQGSNEAVDAFAKFLHEKAKENNGLRLSSETKSWTHPCIYDYLEEFENEQTCETET